MTDVPGIILDGGDVEPFGEDFPVFPLIHDFTLPSAIARQTFVHGGIEDRVLQCRSQQAWRKTYGLLRRVSGDVGECLVDFQHNALVIGDDHALKRLERGGGNTLGFFSLLARGDIAGDGKLHPLTTILHRNGMGLHPPSAAFEADDLKLQLH